MGCFVYNVWLALDNEARRTCDRWKAALFLSGNLIGFVDNLVSKEVLFMIGAVDVSGHVRQTGTRYYPGQS